MQKECGTHGPYVAPNDQGCRLCPPVTTVHATVLEAEHYGETERRLQGDPLVIQMAGDIATSGRSLSQFTHEDGQANFKFMMVANDRYRALGGEDGGHIGAIPAAVLAVARELLRIAAEVKAEHPELSEGGLQSS